MDPLVIARIQFAANITFHILFPSLTIALSWLLLFFKIKSNRCISPDSDNPWLKAYRFWVKIFALCFAIGVVSGVTMSFQFGTNWPGFMNTAGNVAGPLLAYEVLTAFFLEATFLGIMLFGGRKVNNTLHTVSVFIVAFGTTLSAFWILSLISWMHTPDGHKIIDGIVHVDSWMRIIFNPSMPLRFMHMLIASGISATFFISGISAYRILRSGESEDIRVAIKSSLYFALFLCSLQIFIGDLHGLQTFKHQPRKVAAMEGIWNTEKGADLRLFAIPDKKTRSNKFEIKIPKASSIILTHSLDGEVRGLNEFEDHPPVAPVFFSFRIMVGLGFAMFALSAFSTLELLRKGKLGRLSLKLLLLMTFSGLIATLAGWYTTEIGRQPWLIEGILRTRDAAGNVSSTALLSTLLGYIAVYLFLTFSFIVTIFYMARKADE